METNFKGTLGEYYSAYNGQYHEVKRKEDHQDNRIQSISLMLYNDDLQSLTNSKECMANRDLMRDAFNVRQQINVDLPELLKQREELLEVVRHLLSLKHVKDMDGKTPYYLDEMPKAWDKANNLITKIEQK